MKRGWIHWNRTEMPPEAFEARLGRVRRLLAGRDLDALAVYSDVWRSNHARYFVNFMPYWDRSLVVIPREGQSLLLCGLSPRVYPWIRSVSVLEEIHHAANPGTRLSELAAEKQWRRVGLLGRARWPQEVLGPLGHGTVSWEDISAATVYEPGFDEWELAMRRRAASIARNVLIDEMSHGDEEEDHRFVARLERSFRRAGAEDTVILVTDGRTVPALPRGRMFRDGCSVSAAVEYCGHWVRLSRPQTTFPVEESLHHRWEVLLRHVHEPALAPCFTETLSGALPYEFCDRFELLPGDLFALHTEFRAGAQRLFYGDSCRLTESGPEPL